MLCDLCNMVGIAYMKTNNKNRVASPSIHPALIYLVTALVSIIFSDDLIQAWVVNIVDLDRWKTFKWVAFVVVNVALMFRHFTLPRRPISSDLTESMEAPHHFRSADAADHVGGIYSHHRLLASIRYKAESELGFYRTTIAVCW